MLGGSRHSPVRWLLSPARCACCALTVLSRALVAPLTPCRGLGAPATRWVWGLRAQPCCGGLWCGGFCHTLSSGLLSRSCFGGSCFGGCAHSLGLVVVVTALVFCRCCSAPRCQSERPQDGQEREGRRQPLPGLVPRYSVLDAVTWVRSGWRGAWCLQASGCLLCPAGRAAEWDASPTPSCGHAALHKAGSQRQRGSDL